VKTGSGSARAVLVLEDGRTMQGEAYGAVGTTFGEAVFSTGMSGYQETLTDPSYHRQVVIMTAPHIGNTGMNDEDAESARIWVAGYVVRDPSRIASNWRATRGLEQQLQDQSFKVDALLESGNALLRPKPRVWTEEAEEPQSPVKSPKKPRAVPLDDTEEDTPKVKVQRQRQETDSEDEEDPPSPVRSPIRSFRPVPSPTREAGSRTEPRSPTLQSFPAPQTTKEKPSPIGLKVQRVVSGSSPLSSSLPVEGVSQLVTAGKQQETERSATEALTAMSAESVAEERALLEQLSPNEQAVFYKAKALLEHQRVWELAVRTGMCSKATQTGEQGLPLPAIQAIDDEDIETEGTPWLKQLAPSPQGLSPRSKRRYHQAVLKAFVGHSERCGAVCQHLLRAMQVRRKVRGLLLPLRVVNVRYRLAK